METNKIMLALNSEYLSMDMPEVTVFFCKAMSKEDMNILKLLGYS
jgi:hypothetical protein